MGRWNRFAILTCTSVALMSGALAARADVTIHVSPDGDDAGDGSAARPLATLGAAQQHVRRALAEQPPAVTVAIAPGQYVLEQTLILGPEDAGPDADRPVTYAAVGGDVVVSGGRRLDGWRQQGERWIASAPKDGDLPAFRDLWVNGRRAVRARTPNEGYLRVERAGPDNRTSFVAAEGEWVELAEPTTAEVVFLHDWSVSRIPLAGVDRATRHYRFTAPIGGEAGQFAITNFEPHPRYYWENARELLDAPGEWFLDQAAGELHYGPREGESPATAEVVAPRLERLLLIRGEGDRPAGRLRFRGITFAHTRFDVPPYGFAGIQSNAYERRTTPEDHANVTMAAAVTLDGAVDCQFEQCRFEHLGGCGLHLARSTGTLVSRCGFSDVGGEGVLVGSRREDDAPVAARNAVVDCLIEDCGVTNFGAVGLWIGFAQDTLVAHNELRRLPYTGVSVGWRWDDSTTNCRGHRIENNHIHHVMQALSDGGGIYTLGRQPGTRLAGNVIHDVPLNVGRAESNGIFMDEGSTEITVEGNAIYNVARSPIRFHRAGKNLVRRNRLATAGGVPLFMYNNTREEVVDRVENEQLPEGWEPSAGDAVAAHAGPRQPR